MSLRLALEPSTVAAGTDLELPLFSTTRDELARFLEAGKGSMEPNAFELLLAGALFQEPSKYLTRYQQR
jgi:hypothetical protein